MVDFVPVVWDVEGRERLVRILSTTTTVVPLERCIYRSDVPGIPLTFVENSNTVIVPSARPGQ